MKNKFKFYLSLLLLTSCMFNQGCIKEVAPSRGLLCGYVIEKGTGDPVPDALVYMLAYGDPDSTGIDYEIISQVSADKDGYFEMENIRHPNFHYHSLWTETATHYTEGNGFEYMENSLDKYTRRITLPVYRMGFMTVRIKRRPGGNPSDEIEVWNTRSTSRYIPGTVLDTTLVLNANLYVENSVSYRVKSIFYTDRTNVNFLVKDNFQDTLQIVY